jgi:hypothetical protein
LIYKNVYIFILLAKLHGKEINIKNTNIFTPIEMARWQNINQEDRVCNLLQGREMGDEYHYLFECTEFI